MSGRTRQTERTFVFLKPESVLRSHIGEILSRIEKSGLTVVAAKLIRMSSQQAEKLYEMHKGKNFFRELVSHVTSGPVFAMVLEGPSAVSVMRKLIGSTNPVDAEPGTIRADFALSMTMNAIHAADSEANAERELSIFFTEDEVVPYKRVDR